MEGALDPSRPWRSVLSGEMDASFGCREIRHYSAKLSWFRHHESAFGKRMVHPRPCGGAFKVLAHAGMDLFEEVQRPPHLCVFAHAGIFSREIFIGVGHHNAALARLVVSWTPDFHRLVYSSEPVAAVGFPEAALGLRVGTGHR